jgi:hypothetical protein
VGVNVSRVELNVIPLKLVLWVCALVIKEERNEDDKQNSFTTKENKRKKKIRIK